VREEYSNNKYIPQVNMKICAEFTKLHGTILNAIYFVEHG
jgi:hypothetical protein